MGLDTTHNCWHGPYSSFNRFRHSLASQIGINLDEYVGYGPTEGKDLNSIQHGIRPLLNHSDCDGFLTVKEAKEIAKGLSNILENFDEEIEADFNFKENIEQFREGCLLAVKENKKIEFH